MIIKKCERNLKNCTSTLIGVLLILIVGGVIIVGYFTYWFGLIPKTP